MLRYLYLYSVGNYSTPVWFTLPLLCFGLCYLYTALGYLPSKLLWVTLTDEDYATSITLLGITFSSTLLLVTLPLHF